MLKTAIWFLMLLVYPVTAWAQTDAQNPKEPNALVQGKAYHGFYFAPSLQMTRLQGTSGFMVGGKAAWLFNHKIGLGLAGYALTTQNNIGEIQETNNAFLQVGYGGALVEYIPKPDHLFHLTFPLVIGFGGAAYTDNFSDNQTSGTFSYEMYDTDTFMVIEPGITAEFNVARFMRLGLTFSYRFTHGVALSKTTDHDLSAPALSLTAKFGRF